MKNNDYNKVIIASASRIPFGEANSVAIIRIAEAFQNKGLDTRLLVFRSVFNSKNNIWNKTFKRYNLKNKIKSNLIYWPFNRGLNIIIGLYFLILFFFKTRKKTLVLTRSNITALFSYFLGFDTIYESHAPPDNRINKLIESNLLSSKKVTFILISKELKKIYLENDYQFSSYLILPSAGRIKKNINSNSIGDAVNICYIGSLDKGRGFNLIKEIAENLPDRNFHIFGNSNLTNQSDELIGIPSNLYLYDSITPLQAEIFPNFFDVLLMPYQKKVFLNNGLDTSKFMSPMKMYEYMLSEKPIISSNLKVIKETLVDNENSLLVDPKNVDDWVEGIKKLDDPKFRSYLSNNAYKTAIKNFTWECRVNKILSYLKNKI